MKPASCLLLVVALLGGVAAGSLAAEPPLVVVLDSSRSVKPPQFSAAATKLADALQTVPGQVSTGLLEFNDAPTWVVPVGAAPSTVREATRAVSPAGNHTLLFDAIATAVRALPAGGVVLLVTDGKDEGSVATAGDVSALCSVHHVRILTLALGPRPNVRTLQRLALLTGGKHLGAIESVGSADIGQALVAARRELAAVLPTPVPAPQPAPQATAPAAAHAGEPARQASRPVAEPTQVAAEPVATSPNLLLVLLGVVAAVAAVVLFVVWRSKKAGGERVCPDCGQPMASWEANCSNCAIEKLQLRQAESEAGVAPPAEALQPEVEIFDASEFAKLPTEERLEKTFSLEEHAVLIVRQQRRPVRTFALDPTKVIHAGRAGTVNTVAIDDPSISGQHFKIVPKDGEFFILDLDSTNGVYVNGERVKVHKLKSGDTIMAGQVECEFRMQFVRRG